MCLNLQPFTITLPQASWRKVLAKLQEGDHYNIRFKVLNSLHHGGVPQNRPRVYIVGIQRSAQVQPFRWPAPSKPPPLDQFLDKADKENIQELSATVRANLKAANKAFKEQQIDPLQRDIIVDVGAGKRRRHWVEGHVPCITKSRGGGRGFWSTKRCRRLWAKEMVRLQGFRNNDLRLDGLSEHKIGQLVGNSMTVGVVQGVLRGVLVAIGRI